MTDIARPSNPALSFSSFNDEPVAYRMTTYPDRIEILTPSPRTTITGDSLGTPDDRRSKSAPPNPNPAQAQEELETLDEVAILLSSTYDPRRHRRCDSSPNTDACQTVEKNRTRYPDVGLVHVLRTPPTKTAGVSALNAGAKATSSPLLQNALIIAASSDNREYTNAEDSSDVLLSSHSQRQEEPVIQVDGRILSRPIPQIASQLSTQQHQGGGTLILRPNPVKAAEITTTHLSPSELVRAVATATSDQVETLALNAVVTLHPHQERADEGSEHEKDFSSSATPGTPTEIKKLNESLCSKAFTEAEKEIKRRKKEEQEQRKHEFQVNFPDSNDTLVMPSITPGREGDQHHLQNGDEAGMRQTQQQNHRDRMNSLRASSGGGASSIGNRARNNEEMHNEPAVSSRSIQPTPLFERLVTEEVQELKTYAGIVERQNQELAKQKKVQEDLEARLRAETRRRKELESLLEEQERLWTEKFVDLELQRDAAEKKLQDEQTKTKKLINQVQRKDRDIHDFFKKKYDHDGGRSIRSSVRGGMGSQTDRNPQSSTSASAARSADFPLQSPQQLLNDLGSDEKVREGNAKNLLLDFFGI